MNFLRTLLVISIFIINIFFSTLVNAQAVPLKSNSASVTQNLSQQDINDLYALIMDRGDALSGKMLDYTNQSLQYAKDTINYFLIILGFITVITALLGWKTLRDVKKNTHTKIVEIAEAEIRKITTKLEAKVEKLDEKVGQETRSNLLWNKFRGSNDSEEKTSILEKLILENPNDAYLYYQKGLLLEEVEKYEEAIVAIDKAIELEPEQGAAFFAKARCLYEMKKYEEAIVAIDRALELKKVSKYVEFKANVFQETMRYEDAIKLFEQARNIELNENEGMCKDYTGYLINISYCYHKLRKFSEAYNKARIGLKFGFRLELLVNKGLAEAGLNRREDAIESLELARETGIRSGEVVYCQARMFSLLKDHDNALEYLKRAIVEDKKFTKMADEEEDFNFVKNTEGFKVLLTAI